MVIILALIKIIVGVTAMMTSLIIGVKKYGKKYLDKM